MKRIIPEPLPDFHSWFHLHHLIQTNVIYALTDLSVEEELSQKSDHGARFNMTIGVGGTTRSFSVVMWGSASRSYHILRAYMQVPQAVNVPCMLAQLREDLIAISKNI